MINCREPHSDDTLGVTCAPSANGVSMSARDRFNARATIIDTPPSSRAPEGDGAVRCNVANVKKLAWRMCRFVSESACTHEAPGVSNGRCAKEKQQRASPGVTSDLRQWPTDLSTW